MEICALPRGARILDEGCGEGDTLAYLAENYAARGIGIDASRALAARGKEKRPTLDLRWGEMETLDFPSCAFDAVIMECALSLSGMQLEALHEAWCVLKKGGSLIITDLYVRDPDPSEAAKARREAASARARPHAEGDCGRNRELPSEYCLNGAFVKEGLLEACAEAGFARMAWLDRTAFLDSFAAEKIFEYGSMAAYWEAVLPEGADLNRFFGAAAAKNLGYFLLTAKKPLD
jgi:SAM-dependent methyltransferase